VVCAIEITQEGALGSSQAPTCRRDLVRHGLVRLRLAPSRPRRLARRGATVLPPSSGWTAIGPNCASLVSRSTTGEPHPMERDDLEHEAIADNAWNCGRYLSRWVPRLPQPTARCAAAASRDSRSRNGPPYPCPRGRAV
jgi:hypothetical protein